jgi:hypothetical protein
MTDSDDVDFVALHARTTAGVASLVATAQFIETVLAKTALFSAALVNTNGTYARSIANGFDSETRKTMRGMHEATDKFASLQSTLCKEGAIIINSIRGCVDLSTSTLKTIVSAELAARNDLRAQAAVLAQLRADCMANWTAAHNEYDKMILNASDDAYTVKLNAAFEASKNRVISSFNKYALSLANFNVERARFFEHLLPELIKDIVALDANRVETLTTKTRDFMRLKSEIHAFRFNDDDVSKKKKKKKKNKTKRKNERGDAEHGDDASRGDESSAGATDDAGDVGDNAAAKVVADDAVSLESDGGQSVDTKTSGGVGGDDDAGSVAREKQKAATDDDDDSEDNDDDDTDDDTDEEEERRRAQKKKEKKMKKKERKRKEKEGGAANDEEDDFVKKHALKESAGAQQARYGSAYAGLHVVVYDLPCSPGLEDIDAALRARNRAPGVTATPAARGASANAGAQGGGAATHASASPTGGALPSWWKFGSAGASNGEKEKAPASASQTTSLSEKAMQLLTKVGVGKGGTGDYSSYGSDVSSRKQLGEERREKKAAKKAKKKARKAARAAKRKAKRKKQDDSSDSESDSDFDSDVEVDDVEVVADVSSKSAPASAKQSSGKSKGAGPASSDDDISE